ncbi:MAG: hypothetical protein U1C74_11505 [Phenylobacterium sp.]|nr:hypothetical protein [Phenylobacterium sp.]
MAQCLASVSIILALATASAASAAESPITLASGTPRAAAPAETRCAVTQNGPGQPEVSCTVSRTDGTSGGVQVLIRAEPPPLSCDAGPAQQVALSGAEQRNRTPRPVVIHDWTTRDCAS